MPVCHGSRGLAHKVVAAEGVTFFLEAGKPAGASADRGGVFEQQIEAEDDSRICVRRGSQPEAKPKKKRRKMTEDDE